MQFFLLVILRVSVELLPFAHNLRRPISLFALMTLGLLVLSEDVLSLPAFGDFEFTLMPISTALFLMFVFDTLFLIYLLVNTGGSRGSPFTPIILLLPVFAIFLKEPFYPRVAAYVILAVIALSIGFAGSRYPASSTSKSPEDIERDRQQYRRESWVFWGVAVASLTLATFVAWMTQP